jgi:hypothetical protein
MQCEYEKPAQRIQPEPHNRKADGNQQQAHFRGNRRGQQIEKWFQKPHSAAQ